MKMIKLLTIFLIGIITLTTINTVLSVDFDDDRINIQKDIDNLIDQIDKDAVQCSNIIVPEPHNNIRGWHYEDIEIT